MITIIRCRNDTYFGLEGKVEYPSVTHSGYINEENKIMKSYRKSIEDFEKNLEASTYLNKVHVKEALKNEVPDWQKKYKSELKDINYKINEMNGNFSEQFWKRDFTFYTLNNVSIEDLTKQTN